jgi:hypothetical protein
MWDLRADRNYNSVGRNLIQAFDELAILKDKLSLPNGAIEKAAYTYRKAQARRLVAGRTTSAMIAAAIYVACREIGTPWTLKDIAGASNLKPKDIARSYRRLLFEFTNVITHELVETLADPPQPSGEEGFTVSGGDQISDVCEEKENILLGDDLYVDSYWSNKRGGCVASPVLIGTETANNNMVKDHGGEIMQNAVVYMCFGVLAGIQGQYNQQRKE